MTSVHSGQSITFDSINAANDVAISALVNVSPIGSGASVTAGRDISVQAEAIIVNSLTAGRYMGVIGGNLTVGDAISGVDAQFFGNVLSIGSVTAGDDIAVIVSRSGTVTPSATIGTLTSTGLGSDMQRPISGTLPFALDSIGHFVHVVGDANINVTAINSAGSAVVGTRFGGIINVGSTTVANDLLVMAQGDATFGPIQAGGTIAFTHPSQRFDFTGGQVDGGLFGNYDLSTLSTIPLVRTGGSLTLTGALAANNVRIRAAQAVNAANISASNIFTLDSSTSITTGALTGASGINLVGGTNISVTNGTATGGDLLANAGGNIDFTTINSAGGAYVLAGGNAALGTVNAAKSIGVRAINLTGDSFTAGEDITIRPTGTVNITSATAGDDFEIFQTVIAGQIGKTGVLSIQGFLNGSAKLCFLHQNRFSAESGVELYFIQRLEVGGIGNGNVKSGPALE